MSAFTDAVKRFFGITEVNKTSVREQSAVGFAPAAKCGSTSGEAELEGVQDDETAAVILAAVSEFTSVPIDRLKVKSIRSV